MAQKNTAPRLVVKIIGSKHVKQFIEVPQEDARQVLEEEEAAAAAAAQAAEQHLVMESASDKRLQTRVDSALWAGINKVPDRLCVTAPSGDRSRSYIHPKTPQVTGFRAAAETRANRETTRGESTDRDKCVLHMAVREELSNWQLSCLRSTEEEVAALDPSCSGTVNRTQITHLFLKNDVPLKLPTFSLLLHVFSDGNDSFLVDYKALLHFMAVSAFPEEHHDESEVKPQLPGAT